jgi:hypothetical protein
MPKRKPMTIPFEGFLEAQGAEFELRIAEYGQGYAATKDYRYRYTTDEVQIAIRAKFDKWGNSADFLCRPVPATQEDFDALMAAIQKVVSEKREMPEYGSFDIWPFVRQMRRDKRNAERIAAKQAGAEPEVEVELETEAA